MIDPKALDHARAMWRKDVEFRRIAEAYLHAFKEGPGALALEHLTMLFGGNTYDRDPYEHAHNAGRRSVLLHIETLRYVAANPPAVKSESDQ